MSGAFHSREVGDKSDKPRIPPQRARDPIKLRWKRPGSLRRHKPGRSGGRCKAIILWLFLQGSLKLRILKLGLLGGGAVLIYLTGLWFTLPDITDPKHFLAAQSTVILDRNGVELYRLFQEEDRTFIPREHIPEHMKQAVIAIEDERFYSRGCIDTRAIARAAFANVFSFKSQGGSTITQQLARNALNLTREKRISRKIKELMLACQLESAYEKEELLDLYLNWIPFGQNAYGVEQASQVYFSTSASGITLAQAAVLAALPQRPSYFSPYGRHVHTQVDEEIELQIMNEEITTSQKIPDETISIGLLGGNVGSGGTTLYLGGRTDQVLKNMEDQGFISEALRLQTLSELEEMAFQPSRETIRAPHFVLWVREQVESLFTETLDGSLLEQGGLTIETTLDWTLQEIAEETVEFHREDLLTRYGGYNMALLSIDPATQEVLAYVGNTDYNDTEHGGKIDMIRAPRQPGSSFKPIVYASTFREGYSPATPIYDVKTRIGEDEPQNFDGSFAGLLSMREALGQSRNIPAAKAFFLGGGEDNILSLAASLGAPSPLKKKQEQHKEDDEFAYGWPLALGAAEVPLLEMTQVYSSFANMGESRPAFAIRRIRDRSGNLLYEAEEQNALKILDPRIAYQITSVLSDESARPEGYWRSQLTVPGYETAAKTGTSNKCMEWTEPPDENDPPVYDENGEIVPYQHVCLLRKPDNAWLLGYTPNLVTGVWVGNADSSALFDRGGGLNTASPIWRDYMSKAHRKLEDPETVFEVPEGIKQMQISTLSGELPTACTPVGNRRAEVFLEDRTPKQKDPACRQLVVDKVTGLLASDACPKDALESGSFLVVQSLLPERWPFWEEGVQDWVTEQMELWYATPNHSGAVIPLAVAPSEECDPALTPGRLEKPEVRITFPSAGGTAAYPSFKPMIQPKVGSSVRSVRYKIDGKTVATITESPFSRPIRIPRSIKREGIHSLEVELTDRYYNKATARVRFSFGKDSGAPVVSFIEPIGHVVLHQEDTLTMEVEATDNQGGVKYVQFFLGDTLLTTKPKEPYTMEYPLSDLDQGTYTITAKASDFSGNQGSDVLTVTVE